MQRLSTRWFGSSRPFRNSGSSCCVMASLVKISSWSMANCERALQAACRTRMWLAPSCAWIAPTICVTVASSSTYSAICEIRARPATVCFHWAPWKRVAMAGFMISMTCGNFSAFCMHPLIRSRTSLPLVNMSSSSASSSSSAAQASTSSSSSIKNCTQISMACWMKPGTLEMALGLPSTKDAITSRASLRESSCLWDLATVERSGIKVEATASLKKSIEFAVPSMDCRTALRCFASSLFARRCIAVQRAGVRGENVLRSFFSSSWSMSSQSMPAALACTPSWASPRHTLSTSPVCEELAAMTGQIVDRSSFTAQSASARRPPSRLASMMSFMRVGRSSGHAGQLFGRVPSSMSINWLPRLWTMSATFLRTFTDCSASSSARSLTLHSGWAAASFSHVDPVSLAFPRHCLSRTAACSRTASST
mmetsp:Transcript_946/g.2667  ORF Transcript_946/g.2667 Transcript_946/m.2667 type:complete len:423 (+) Transcript_946:2179-3447(+)